MNTSGVVEKKTFYFSQLKSSVQPQLKAFTWDSQTIFMSIDSDDKY